MSKKIISLFLSVLLMLSAVPGLASQITEEIPEKYEKAVERLLKLGIIEGYEDGSIKVENDVTRAEFVTIVLNTLGLNGIMFTESSFKDVPVDHWAVSNIKFATDIGLVCGVGDGAFAPDASVTYEQAVKIVVEALGYGVAAEKDGGYPEGYISVASKQGLLKKLSSGIGSKMTRGDVAVLIDAAIDIPVIEKVIGKDLYFQVLGEDENTLYEKFMSRLDLINVRGIVTATDKTSIDGNPHTDEGFVKIGNEVYKVGSTNICDYLGYAVDAYVTNSDSDNANTVMSCGLLRSKNKTLKIAAEDISEGTTLEKIFYTENNRRKSEDISNAEFIYNGKHILKSSLTDNDLVIYNGELLLIDNDGVSGFDVVFITERESFVVQRISSSAKSVYFKSGVNFRGREGFRLENDEDKEYFIYNNAGEIIEFSDVKTNDVVTLEISKDNSLGKIYVSDAQVSGKISLMSEEEGIVVIEDTEYSLYKNAGGTVEYTPILNQDTVFLLNCDGYIVDDDGNRTLQHKYAFVTAAGQKGSLSGILEIKAVVPGKKEKIVETLDGVENISYVFKNDNVIILETADKVKYTREGYSKATVKGTEIGSEIVNTVIRYRVNKDGQITELENFTPSRLKRYFNAEILSFGGTYDGDGFVADGATEFLMIPEGYLSAVDDDYLVDVEIVDEAYVNVVPIVVDDETQVAETILIYANMDAETPKPFKDTTLVSIVGKIKNKVDENGEWGSVLQVLSKDKIEETFVPETARQSELVSSLIKGDLIRYNETSDGQIDNIERIATIQGLGDYYFRSNPNSPNEVIYGQVESVKLHRLISVYNEFMDVVTVNYGGGVATYHIPCEDRPEFYAYDRESGNISVAVPDDIISTDVAGSDATKIYLLVDKNEVKAGVLISD